MTATTSSVNIGILGAGGRMGQMLVQEILSGRHEGAVLSSACDRDDSWALGQDIGSALGLGPSGVTVTADKNACFDAADVLIDFSAPEATMEHAQLAYATGRALVVGTTGLSDVQDATLTTAAERAPVLHAANMSVGVNVLLALIEQAAKILDHNYDIEIFEAHHRHKIDAPSGTALAMAQTAAAARGIRLESALIPGRYGNTGARVPGSIGMSVFRGGDVVGDHTMTFAGTGERLELTHKASDRALFARGAVRAALWLKGQSNGRYTMRDVLGL